MQPFPAKSQLREGASADEEAVEPKREHIMLLGRFFKGRQSKVGGCVVWLEEGWRGVLPWGAAGPLLQGQVEQGGCFAG